LVPIIDLGNIFDKRNNTISITIFIVIPEEENKYFLYEIFEIT
jgi:hypothetical protein